MYICILALAHCSLIRPSAVEIAVSWLVSLSHNWLHAPQHAMPSRHNYTNNRCASLIVDRTHAAISHL